MTVYVGGVGVGVRWCANCYEVIFVDSSIDNPSDSLWGWGGLVWGGGGGVNVCRVIFVIKLYLLTAQLNSSNNNPRADP